MKLEDIDKIAKFIKDLGEKYKVERNCSFELYQTLEEIKSRSDCSESIKRLCEAMLDKHREI